MAKRLRISLTILTEEPEYWITDLFSEFFEAISDAQYGDLLEGVMIEDLGEVDTDDSWPALDDAKQAMKEYKEKHGEGEN